MASTTFQFSLSPAQPDVSALAQAVIHLSEIAEQLANEDRTAVNHASGRAENVAEHSNMLAIIGPAIAEQFFPELDANLVARYATIHDSVEAYVGDTPTYQISEQGLLDKAALEAAGLQQLKQEFQQLSTFAAFIADYEAQIIAEARFVRVLDKCMPALLHFADGGKVLREYITAEGVRANSAERAASLRAEYPDLERLIALREELSELLVSRFLSGQ